MAHKKQTKTKKKPTKKRARMDLNQRAAAIVARATRSSN